MTIESTKIKSIAREINNKSCKLNPSIKFKSLAAEIELPQQVYSATYLAPKELLDVTAPIIKPIVVNYLVTRLKQLNFTHSEYIKEQLKNNQAEFLTAIEVAINIDQIICDIAYVKIQSQLIKNAYDWTLDGALVKPIVQLLLTQPTETHTDVEILKITELEDADTYNIQRSTMPGYNIISRHMDAYRNYANPENVFQQEKLINNKNSFKTLDTLKTNITTSISIAIVNTMKKNNVENAKYNIKTGELTYDVLISHSKIIN